MPLLMLKDLPRYECLLECAKRFPDLDPTAGVLFMQLLRAADELFSIKSSFLQRHSISNGRFTVLMLLLNPPGEDGTTRSEVPPRSPADLADMAGVTRATMTGLIDTLEKDGYVRREPDPRDRRAMLVHLTPKGEAFTEELFPGYFKQMAAIMAPLQRSERDQLVLLLDKIRQGIAIASAMENQAASAV